MHFQDVESTLEDVRAEDFVEQQQQRHRQQKNDYNHRNRFKSADRARYTIFF